MPRISAILHLLVGGAIMAPLLAFGHACEFLVAKMEVRQGMVQLEITADYGGNPMLPDETAAREAVQRILQVHTAGQSHPLQDLAPLTFERRQQWDPATPASFAPPPDGQSHELITARWRWQPTVNEVTFSVPKGSPNDVLLWTTAAHLPGKQVQWMLLIEGDSSPVIAIPQPPSTSRSQWWWSPLTLFALAAVLLFVRSRRSRAP
jgi:hypothetical protein